MRVANARMAGAIRLVSIERGHDPGRFALVPFGGGGALHAGALLKEVGLKAALVPRFPGVLGVGLRDRGYPPRSGADAEPHLKGLDCGAFRPHGGEAEAARGVVERAGLPIEGVEIRFEFDMHYLGQTHTVAAPFAVAPGAAFTEDDVRQASRRL